MPARIHPAKSFVKLFCVPLGRAGGEKGAQHVQLLPQVLCAGQSMEEHWADAGACTCL